MTDQMRELSERELVDAANEFTGGRLEELSLADLGRLITIAQHVADLVLNEIEARGELTFIHGVPCVPYQSDYMVETILTRQIEPV